MADFYVPFRAGQTAATVQDNGVWFAPSNADAQLIADVFNESAGAGAYSVYVVAEADIGGTGTVEDLPGFTGWKYRKAAGDDVRNGFNVELVEFVFDDSSSASDSGPTSASGTSSASGPSPASGTDSASGPPVMPFPG